MISRLPSSEFSRTETLQCGLNQKPADDTIRYGHLVHVAPLQLAEEYFGFIARVLLALIFRASELRIFWKRDRRGADPHGLQFESA